MTTNGLIAEVKKLRQEIRNQRDSTGDELFRHRLALWKRLLEPTHPVPAVPAWPEFTRGCVRHRQWI
jgi:hypothetical protein